MQLSSKVSCGNVVAMWQVSILAYCRLFSSLFPLRASDIFNSIAGRCSLTAQPGARES